MTNKNLQHAKAAKNDEFYTMLSDIENELQHYTEQFKGKTVYCNCDDPERSNFWKYFHLNFEKLHLKRLISTHYEAGRRSYKMEYEGGNDNDIECGVKTPLDCDGDFRSAECIRILDEADIVVTNPPFSLFREYICLLVSHKRKFLVIGNKNAITYKEIFPLIKENRIWLGYCNPSYFYTSSGITKDVNGLCRWFTNLDMQKRHENIQLTRKYNPADYQHYDNYDAINVDRVKDIPCDYCESWEVTSAELEFLPADAWQVVRKGFRDDVETFFIIPAEHTELREALHEHAPGYREKIEAEIEKTLKKNEILQRNPRCADYVYRQIQSKSIPDYRNRPILARQSKIRTQIHNTEQRSLCKSCHQKDTVMESLECQSHTLINIAKSNSRLSESQQETYEVFQELEREPKKTGRISKEVSGMEEYLCGRYCNGIIGVPITVLDKYNPEQFEICDANKIMCKKKQYLQTDILAPGADGWHVNRRRKYARVFIRKIL